MMTTEEQRTATQGERGLLRSTPAAPVIAALLIVAAISLGHTVLQHFVNTGIPENPFIGTLALALAIALYAFTRARRHRFWRDRPALTVVLLLVIFAVLTVAQLAVLRMLP
ncbi:hypothetical protein JSO19_02215 [Leucobacter sp. UCMA 4100]|uniref:hypothetical protein n=1 Tax=Leucobacter sp. UCMA 4100 TaxID=2810534 RepID=UPI0022EA76E5|nr:hypothetical protein [Leucobacter sp. UCMA 4100]MDA3146191.1 hypothetical protein [Leucobacter sp. UCMA 4100]